MHIRRCAANPIIRPDMLPGTEGANINGPSLIRAPDWLPSPPGRYLLYFAHHGGTYIRLAHADDLEGPWRIHAGGTLALADAPGAYGHIASPDVLIDDERRELRMYFHGMAGPANHQRTFLATSRDGLRWTASACDLGPFYFRVFRHGGAWFAFAKGGDLYRSDDGTTPFALVGNPFGCSAAHRPGFNASGDIRHLAVDRVGDVLWAWHSRIGDAPERLIRQRIGLGPDPAAWRADPPEEALRPELPWEGADLPVVTSRAGAEHGPVHAVRDPGLLRDGGRLWLVYSVAGESGLAIAEVLAG